MNISDRELARRYARAFYESAAQAKEEERAGLELSEIVRQLSGSLAAYQHPRVSSADKMARLRREVGSKTLRRTLRFLELLVEKKRFALLPMIAQDYGRLRDEARGIAHATVRAAADLSPEQRAALEKALGERTGKKVVLDVKVRPELIAGAVVRLGDWVFDASLRGGLDRLRSRLTA